MLSLTHTNMLSRALLLSLTHTHEIDLDGEDALRSSSFEVLSNVVQEYRLFRGGLVFKARRLLFKSTLGSAGSNKEEEEYRLPPPHLSEASNRLFEDIGLSWRSPESGDACVQRGY